MMNKLILNVEVRLKFVEVYETNFDCLKKLDDLGKDLSQLNEKWTHEAYSGTIEPIDKNDSG